MIRSLLLSMIFVMMCATPSMAAEHVKIKYHTDPILGANGDHPMTEVKALAEKGDVRAQFILADLYAKGKGGFAKSTNTARKWFEESARNGNHFSFIRLAALEKRVKKPIDAYKWYTLALDTMNYRDDARKWADTARADLVADVRLDAKDIKSAKENVKAWKAETAQMLKEKKLKEQKEGEKENDKN